MTRSHGSGGTNAFRHYLDDLKGADAENLGAVRLWHHAIGVADELAGFGHTVLVNQAHGLLQMQESQVDTGVIGVQQESLVRAR
ncbi:hypothetical protein PUR71_25705 [Streptomyces sp. SP17BM10]|uniref:hypothetical protein n=1 Tax=Streptomyces sp. SP17BM10 TaxID=3002530 RepID=UPI002E7A9EE1|nr:hypothetical protein [Streptomyces sp. SP17BM10]MEE1786270.1 hypothetical protein [Streptomyces sp. SP17BM10]